jgi:subtilase family serine protease
MAVASAVAQGAAGQAVVQGSSALAKPANLVGATPAATPVEFTVALTLSDAAGASALAREVSDPKSPSYRHFLTPLQWERRFSPSESSVRAVATWLRGQGIAIDGVAPDRMTVQASATAATVEKAFGTTLGQYRRGKRVVRLAAAPLTVPSSISGLIAGVNGIDQSVATPDHLTGGEARPAKKGSREIPQPEGFRNAPPCSSSYGEKSDLADPPFGGGYPEPLPYAPCGYVPAQLQGAYGLTPQIAAGNDGKGSTVAVIDAYASPTLFADSQHYSELNQAGQLLSAGQYSQLISPTFNQTELCEASEWFGEQTLDVEAVHATAPGAKILYVGAKNCLNGLLQALQKVVDGHLADIVTNSWGDNGGDLLDSTGMRRSYDDVLQMAIGTGIGVQFSAGDEGDEFANLGMTVADYPPSSPYATAVGGTSLQVSAAGGRAGELGWSTSKSVLCSETLAAGGFPGCTKAKLGKWMPKAPGSFLYGGGGGTSFQYPQPFYQEGVVPEALAARNASTTGVLNRVEPDISMVGDPTTGMLIGETQSFPEGTHYDQFRLGGTSLSSPLLAGVMADANTAAGGPLGFVNPLLYELASSAKATSAFYDVVPGGLQALIRNDYLDGVDASAGIITSARTLDFQGHEKFCSGTGNCTQQKVAIETATGFDSMTGIGTPAGGLIGALAAP